MNPGISPISFTNRNGYRLFGMLHMPAGARRGVGIVILSPGIKGRVAPHRLYLRLAQRFCELGFPVLRFDPEGLGDSEGEIEQAFTADVYGEIEQGRVVADTISAMDWMQRHAGVQRFVMAGLCGGAITGLLAGATDQRVAGLLGLGITCVVSGSQIDPTRFMSLGQLDSIRMGYLKKLFDPGAWRRFLSAQSDYRLLAKSLAVPLLKRLRKSPATTRRESDPNANQDKDAGTDNFNPLFPDAFFRVVVNRQVLLVFSEADRLYWEYTEKFETRYAEHLAAHQQNLEVRVVKDANHIFSFEPWKAEMLELSSRWLQRFFCRDRHHK